MSENDDRTRLAVLILEPLSELVERFVDRSKDHPEFTLERFTTAEDLLKSLEIHCPAVALLTGDSRAHFRTITKITAVAAPLIKKKLLKIIVISKHKDVRLLDALLKMGCSECVPATLADHSFGYKVLLQLRAMSRAKAQQDIEDFKLSSKGEKDKAGAAIRVGPDEKSKKSDLIFFKRDQPNVRPVNSKLGKEDPAEAKDFIDTCGEEETKKLASRPKFDGGALVGLMRNLSDLLASGSSPDQVYRLSTEAVKELLKADRATLIQTFTDKKSGVVLASHGRAPQVGKIIPVSTESTENHLSLVSGKENEFLLMSGPGNYRIFRKRDLNSANLRGNIG